MVHTECVYTIASIVKNHRLYGDYVKVKERLREHQYVCWLAGGAVRDFLLGRSVNEFDLVTDAKPENLKQIFPEAVLVGESFGVLKIPLWEPRDFFDLAGFREESDYADGRRPNLVKSATPTKDAQRRDFTINALYWDDENEKIIDYVSGLADLRERKLRCVGNAEVRFAEDHLRLLRLLRFAVVLEFNIEDSSLHAAQHQLHRIADVSGERIWAELKKISQGVAWERALQLPLFSDMIREILKIEIQTDFKSVVMEKLSAQVMFYLLNPEFDLSSILKLRLKLSNQELLAYTQTRFLMKSVGEMSLKNLTFELEKSNTLHRQFNHLVELGLVEKSIDLEIKKTLAENSKSLITAAELSSLIPVQNIAEEIRAIRLGQYAKIFKTKEEVLAYLEKKYAIKS